MQIIQSPMTVADYCAAMDRHEIKPNDSYQRSSKVWPPAARSFLIESVILGFPLPKIFLFQRTDLLSKKTVKEIVDGQQRSRAIHDFFHNKLRLSRTSEVVDARGKTYDQLDDDLKGKFLSYPLSIDLFISASTTEIRQSFRRLNSYTIPLNPEELRHAEYQGEFKWFIYEITRDYEEFLIRTKVFGEKQIIRMQDEKLFTDCAYTFINGWRTTKKNELESLYKAYDKEFEQSVAMRERFDQALEFIAGIEEIHGTALMKPHVFHTLLVAVSDYMNPIAALSNIPETAGDRLPVDKNLVTTNLTALADALDSGQPEDRFADFVNACADQTNTGARRLTRFIWLFNALKPELL